MSSPNRVHSFYNERLSVTLECDDNDGDDDVQRASEYVQAATACSSILRTLSSLSVTER